MTVRRAFFYWQFLAAVLLPLWVLVGRGLFGATVGWQFVLLVILMPILGLGMLVVGGLIAARKEVRSVRAVGWLDLAVVGAWHLAIVALGFFLVDTSSARLGGSSVFTQLAGADAEELSNVLANLFGAVTVLIGIAAFWFSGWQLLRETKARVASVLETVERDARRRPVGDAPVGWRSSEGPGAGRIIRLDPSEPPREPGE